MRIAASLISALALLAGIVLLQIYLSRRESKWPGLVFPIVSFLSSLSYPLAMAVPSEGATAGFIVQMVMVWLLVNIPTVVFLAIYFACHEKPRRNKQLDKMNIQDLG